MRIKTSIAILVLAAVAGSGCGAQSEEQDVATAANTFYGNLSGERYEEACDGLSAQAKAAIGNVASASGTPQRCEQALEQLVEAMDVAQLEALEQADVKAEHVRISGEEATVKQPGAGGETKLSHKGEYWLVDFNAEAAAAALRQGESKTTVDGNADGLDDITGAPMPVDPCAPLDSDPTFSNADDLNGDGYVSEDEAAQRIGQPRC